MNVLVSFPYLGMDDAGETTREWAHMRFSSSEYIQTRRVKREVRKWVKRNLGRTLHTRELLLIMKRAVRE